MLAQKGITMLDERKTKSQLITELRDLRQRLLVTEQEQKKLLLSLTQQKRAEKIMHARLRLLKFAESHSLEEFTQATLDESEALTASTIGFYHLVEADQQTLLLQTWSTNTIQHMCKAEGKGQHYDVAEAGVWVECVHQRRPVIHNNYDALPNRKGMPPGHSPVTRELVVPIIRANKIVAIIGVGNKPSDYDDWDVEAVSLLGDLSWDITERKKAEEALHREKDISDTTIESLPGIFYLFDSQGKFLRWNKNFQLVSGYSFEEIASIHPLDFFAGDDVELIKQSINEVFIKGATAVEAEFISKDGQKAPYFFTGLMSTIDHKDCLIGMGIDITDRKRAEKALRQSYQRLDLLADTASQLLASVSPQQVDSICRKVMDFLDCDVFFNFLVADEPKGLLHFNAYAGIPEEEARRIEWLDYGVALCGCAAKDRCPIVTENILNTVDPQTELIKSYGIQACACHPLMVEGRLIGTLSFGTRTRTHFTGEELALMKAVADQVAIAMHRKLAEETLRRLNEELEHRVEERTEELQETVAQLEEEITDRQQAENSLAIERQRFFDVLEMLPAYIVLLTPDYHVAFANRYFVNQFGEDKGRRCFEYLFGRTEPCEICDTYTVLKTNAPHRWEWTGPNERTYDIYDFPFTDVDGSPLIMEMGIDITDRKQAEEEIKKLNEDLEERVRIRTAELEFANRELESFSYSVSHDLKAPIRAIRGFSRMLVGEHLAQLNEEGLRLLNVIVDNTQIMSNLIDDLLALSRTGRQQIKKRVLDLSVMVRQNFERLRGEEPERDLRLIVQDLPQAWGDPSLLNQVVMNVVGNSVKYTRPKKTAVIEVGGSTRDGEAVYFVKDNGVGFNERYGHKLFGVFQRLHRDKEYEGTGVGLAIVQRIIHRHGGRVWAEGKVGKGATFYFSLPKYRE
jgi:PAS domain S-box-containing protein